MHDIYVMVKHVFNTCFNDGGMKMSDNYTYPAIIDNSEQDFINITFPDFDSVFTCVPKDEDYIAAAQDILTLSILDLEESGETVPVQMKAEDIIVEENQKLIYVNIWMPYHRSQVKVSYRKKTLTIPVWIDELAKANHINFSATLVEAIKEKLSLK